MEQVAVLLLVGYAVLTLFTAFIAPSIMFAPPTASYLQNNDTIFLKTSDGVKIAANYYPNPQARFTILYCNGNMSDLGLIKQLMKRFNAEGYAIFAFDYHGYGISDGTPSESTTYLDANAAYDYLINNLHISPDRIIVYGKSLGAGVALQLAINRKVAGLVMESPFVSAYRVYTQYPLIPFDKYRNLAKINQLSSPLLVIHGEQDSVIPFWQGKKLYEKASVPKVKFWVANADHNNVIGVARNGYWDAWQRLIKLIEQNS